MEELAPKAGAAMREFRACMKAKCGGSIATAWRNHFDVGKSGNCDKDHFKKACEEVGFTGDVEKLFQWLDYDGGGSISLREIDQRPTRPLSTATTSWASTSTPPTLRTGRR